MSCCLFRCLQVQSLESDKLSSMGDLQHASLMKVQKEGAPGHTAWAHPPHTAAAVGLVSLVCCAPCLSADFLPQSARRGTEHRTASRPHLAHPSLTSDTTPLPLSLFCVAAPLFSAHPTLPPAALREVASASWRLLAAIVSIQSRTMRCNLEPLHKFTQWVAQQRAANMFRGQVAGPLGVEIKLKSRINGRALDRNWVANLEQVRGGGGRAVHTDRQRQ